MSGKRNTAVELALAECVKVHNHRNRAEQELVRYADAIGRNKAIAIKTIREQYGINTKNTYVHYSGESRHRVYNILISIFPRSTKVTIQLEWLSTNKSVDGKCHTVSLAEFLRDYRKVPS